MKFTKLAAAVLTAVYCIPVFADNSNSGFIPGTPWNPRLIANTQAGTTNFEQLDFLLPLLGNNASLLFADGRAWAISQDQREYNLGLGYRQFTPDYQHIIGINAFADRFRTNSGIFINQASAGLEYLGNVWDVRANGYLPYGNNRSSIDSNDFSTLIAGHTVTGIDNQDIVDALRGADVEVGRVIPGVQGLRAFVGYYHYNESGSPASTNCTRSLPSIENNLAAMNGVRGRAEYYVNRMVTLTAEDEYDNVRHNQAWVGIRLSVGGANAPTHSLTERMEGFIQRDNTDVVTVDTHRIYNFRDPRTYYFVNNAAGAGGDGTIEHPFQNDPQAVAAAGTGNIIYTFAGIAPYNLGGQLALNPNTIFTGSGGNFYFPANLIPTCLTGGSNIIAIAATQAPLLQGSLLIANGDALSNFNITGVGTTQNIGIEGSGVQNASIDNVTVTGYTGTSANGADGTTTGGNGGAGGDAFGIDLENSRDVILTNVRIQNISGGSANGGSVNNTSTDVGAPLTTGTGGNGGAGGNAAGLDVVGSTNAVLQNVIIQNITGGAANGGAVVFSGNNAQGGNGGSAGFAGGVFANSTTNVKLQNVSVQNITGGSANGGNSTLIGDGTASLAGNSGIAGFALGINVGNSTSATLSNIAIANVIGGAANGGNGVETGAGDVSGGLNNGIAGSAVGLTLDQSTSATVSSVSITNIMGGSSYGGDATQTGSGSASGTAGKGGNGGNATGIALNQANTDILSNIAITNLAGGSANGGNATLNGNLAFANAGGTGGNATGLLLTNTNNISLTTIALSNFIGGAANGGNGNSNSGVLGVGGDAGVGGDVSGINFTASSGDSVTNVTLSTFTGGSANGGNGNTNGGNGGTGGSVIGFQTITGVTINNANFNNFQGGTATAGTGMFPGNDGTPGTTQNTTP